MSVRIACLVSIVLVLTAGCARPAEMPDVLALVNGTLIDGTGAEPVPGAVVLIQGDRIVAAGAGVAVPRGARQIDLQGATILPGFINAHVHFAYDEEKLRAWAQGGVTTVRDEAIVSRAGFEQAMAFRDSAGENPLNARLISSGYMLAVPGGYGELFVNSPEEARAKVIEQLDAGVDMIKIAMEDGYAGRHDLPKLTDAEIAAIIAAAHERGTRVSGHITQAKYLRILVEAGVDDIAHIAYDPVPRETWQLMIDRGIYLVPTFTVFRNYGAPVSTCVENLRDFVAMGGRVALGNDYGGGPGEFELGMPMYEIEQMSAAGMTPMQIIVAGTRNAAVVSHVDDRAGTLEPGKLADVLVVDGNPLEDLQALLAVRMVIHNGTLIRGEGSPRSDSSGG